MTSASPSKAVLWRSLIAVIGGLTVASMTGGFNAPLFATRLDEMGVDDWLIGASTAANAIGLFVVAPFAPAIIARFGLAPVMIVTTLLEAVLYLACTVVTGFWGWTIIRLAMGAIGGVLWIAGEVWITQTATDAIRGRVLAIYNACFSMGSAVGPSVLSIVGYAGPTPFIIATAITVASVVPIVWARRLAPQIEDERRGDGLLGMMRSMLTPLRLAPVPMMFNLSYALVFTALWTFLPVYAADTGLDVDRAFQQLTAFAIGGIALQYPIGWLSDRGDSRLVGACLIGGSFLALLAIDFFIHVPVLDFVYFFILGGLVSGLYVVALSLIGAQFRGSSLATAITVYTLMWSAASVFSPPFVGVANNIVGPDGLPLSMVLFTAVFLPFAVASWLRHRRKR